MSNYQRRLMHGKKRLAETQEEYEKIQKEISELRLKLMKKAEEADEIADNISRIKEEIAYYNAEISNSINF